MVQGNMEEKLNDLIELVKEDKSEVYDMRDKLQDERKQQTDEQEKLKQEQANIREAIG